MESKRVLLLAVCIVLALMPLSALSASLTATEEEPATAAADSAPTAAASTAAETAESAAASEDAPVAEAEAEDAAPSTKGKRPPQQYPFRDLPADVLRDFPGLCFGSTALRLFQVGQSWSLTPFCGVATCLVSRDGYHLIERVQDCGLQPKHNAKCQDINEFSEAQFPLCCPKFVCEDGVELEYPTEQELQQLAHEAAEAAIRAQYEQALAEDQQERETLKEREQTNRRERPSRREQATRREQSSQREQRQQEVEDVAVPASAAVEPVVVEEKPVDAAVDAVEQQEVVRETRDGTAVAKDDEPSPVAEPEPTAAEEKTAVVAEEETVA